MEKLYVRGGNPLGGTVQVAGSKNSSLALMAACLLVPGRTVLHNVPDIRDIHTMADLLRELGAEVRWRTGTVEIDATGFSEPTADFELMRKMRASFYVLGPMLARLGRARVAEPGGCDIGARPVDYHLRGLQVLGAESTVEGGIVEATTTGLHGGRVYLDFPSAGATSQLITAAAMARGETVIENAAAEPEVVDLANLLNSLGADVRGAGTGTVVVRGCTELTSGREYTVIPDRIEAGTFACAAAITRGDLTLTNVTASHLKPLLLKLEEMGAVVETGGGDQDQPGSIRVRTNRRLNSADIVALPHPGFPTDLQQPMLALLSLCRGSAVVTDRVFENRFRFVGELSRMGANVRAEGRTAWVVGVDRLTAAPIKATDLRAGAALTIAALAADGESEISEVVHIDRGYEDLVGKLQAVGGDIRRGDHDEQRAQWTEPPAVPAPA